MTDAPLATDDAARFETRRAQVAARVSSDGLAGLLVTDLRNIAYLTGFQGSAGVLLLDPEGRAVLATDSRYDVQVREQAPGCVHVITRSYAAGALAEFRGPTSVPLGVEAAEVTLARAGAIRTAVTEAGLTEGITETTGIVEDIRRVKDAAELESIARACEIADSAWRHLLETDGIRAGRTEREVAADLEHAMRRGGSEGTSFDTIVGSGPNGALPHYRTGDRVLTDGDLVVIDFGALVDGYASDCTRTVAIGTPSEEARAIYDITLDAQLAAVEAVAPGVACADLDAVARDRIAEAGYGENFGHSLGHGVGLDVHEGPPVSAKSDSTLFVGDVVTVEPGIYIPGLAGVRIEDTVAVTADGHRALTTTPKELRHL